jgi:anti-sigma regulatory factor (Ser/Thr protein kinase)
MRYDPTTASTLDADAPGPAIELGLDRDRTAPSIARAWISRRFAADIDGIKLSIARLLVSELVTNALVHGQGAIVLRARLEPGQLFAEVMDEGDGFSWTAPTHDPERTRGWGLALVAGQSDRWGIHQGPASVWFEMSV